MATPPAATPAEPASYRQHLPKGRVAALLPPSCFAVALVFFALALGLAPLVVGELREFFYQRRVLAVTHMLTLGWISTTMIGVLYRYVPGLTKRPLARPRLAVAQVALFVGGTVGLVAHFWLWHWSGVAWSAAVLVAAGLALCGNLWPLVLAVPARGVAEVGVLLASGFLVLAASVGCLLAVDKVVPLVGGATLSNLATHAHLAGLGWVGVTICALSFRFLTAFLLPAVMVPEGARRQVVALAVLTLALAVSLAWRSGLVPVAAGLVALAIVTYLVLLGRVVASHRMPIDWTARHALAGMLWLLVATALGTTLALRGLDDTMALRAAAAYGVAALLGWMSNLIIGMSYKLFPGFVTAARSERSRPAVPVAALEVAPAVRPAVFAAYNAGVVLLFGGLLADAGAVCVAGAVVTALGGGVYVAASARTLLGVVVDPPRSRHPLPVLP